MNESPGDSTKDQTMKTATRAIKTKEGRNPIRRQSSAATKAGSANSRTSRAQTTADGEHSPAIAPARKVLLLPEYLPARVSLRLYQPQATEVRLAGSFNNWDPWATPLQNVGEGRWEVELTLTRGRYEYRFVVDGYWTDDPLASAFVANPFGTLNCLLSVD
jgi:hypothetical protein